VAAYLAKHRSWKGSRDSDGNREYWLTSLVKTSSVDDGPAAVMQCPGLALPGSLWTFGNDIDLWAWCRPDMEISIKDEKEGDGALWWLVRQKFSTKTPTGEESRRNESSCYDQAAQDPLSEPDRISGAFVKEKREGQFAREISYYTGSVAPDNLRSGPFQDIPITNSAFERIHGPQNEWDELLPQVVIEQNVPLLQFDVLAQYRFHVNDAPLWGFPARCVKLSSIRWARNFYQQCYLYYTRTLEFDINPDTWDRNITDEATSYLKGTWSGNPPVYTAAAGADPRKQQHFVRAEDFKGGPKRFVLNGNGEPINAAADAGIVRVQYYEEANFLQLGIPLDF